ncbi:hypothetical protein GGR53DRAFT_366869 [Hypoxylon sp. FL1150]|nr:hypothetical protein GGR53DRAFT_366869 [Hypoxylon sp. FL1150]
MPTISKQLEWGIELVVADDEGSRFYLDQYKPFRLAALKQDPDAFGSTYEREINFTDTDWLGRIKNPLAKTFVAVNPHDKRVLAATSLIGPLSNAGPASNPSQASTEMRDGDDQPQIHGEASPVSYQMAGVYTMPEARGRGIAKALVKVATVQAIAEANRLCKQLALSVIVYSSNHAAISFYESCGFVAAAEGPKISFNPVKDSSDEELCMRYHDQRSPE